MNHILKTPTTLADSTRGDSSKNLRRTISCTEHLFKASAPPRGEKNEQNDIKVMFE